MKFLRYTWLSVLFCFNSLYAQTDSTEVKLNIFPNPNAGTFYITLVDYVSVPAKLISKEGQVVKTFYLDQGLNYISIDVPTGVYILSVRFEETIENFRIKIS